MWGQPSVRGQRSQYTGSRCTAELAPFPRRRLTPDIPGIRSLVLGMCVTLPLVGLWTPGTVNAQDLAESVFAINNELINDTRLTSGLLVAGPPEVAREISIVDSAMFDA